MEIAEAQPDIVAHHYTEAGLNQQAVPYWQKASQQAAQHSANLEAISHLERGLELLKTLPDTPERTQHELTLQISLGPALIATRGYAAPEVEVAFTRARELCQKLGDVPQLFPALRGLSVFYMIRPELQKARELVEQFLSIAQSTQDPLVSMEARLQIGEILFYLGEFGAALEHLEQGFALHDPRQHHYHIRIYGRDCAAACLSFMAQALYMLGYSDKALGRTNEMLELAQELDHPYTHAMVLLFSTFVHQFRRDERVTQELAEAAIALSDEQNFPFWSAYANSPLGWALAQQGQIEEGIARIHNGLAAFRALDSELIVPYFYAMLGEALGRGGKTEEGLAALAQGLAVTDRTGERTWEADLHRLKGELMLMQGADEVEVEACFRKSIEIACHQQAKSWELRSTVSLCRLWQNQGKVDQARRTLQEIYGWFTEGFGTRDLQEAKALLGELS